MKSAEGLLTVLAPVAHKGTSEFTWHVVCSDSRQVSTGAVFFAIPGAIHDGLAYAGQALEAGAVALVVPKERFGQACKAFPNATILAVSNIRSSLAEAAAFAADYPSRSLTCIAVTGTNGKTSTAWLIAQLLRRLGESCLLFGTLGIGVVRPGDEEIEFEESSNTTADPITIQHHLRLAKESGVRFVAMEVTSQGIAQQRCLGIDWDAAIFTNLTRDHLDLHNSLEEYTALKFKLFSELLANSQKPKTVALCNTDDSVGLEFYQRIERENLAKVCLSLSLNDQPTAQRAAYLAKEIVCDLAGIHCQVQTAVESAQLHTKLLGHYNAYNILSAVAILHGLDFPLAKLVTAAQEASSVPGRLERVGTGDVFVFVDYSHTPDALTSVLNSVRELPLTKLTCVFGCGGDRDRGKRPLMAQAVATLADKAILTSDNPRTENPEQIIQDSIPGFTLGVEPGVDAKAKGLSQGFTWQVIVNRREAIHRAIQEAIPGEVIVVAGKGHEDYQEIQGVKYPFLDRTVCQEALQSIGKL